MKSIKILRYSTLWAAMAVVAAGFCSCDDDNEGTGGQSYFRIEGLDEMNINLPADGTVNSADATGMSELTSGIIYNVYAKGCWEIVPEDPSADWARVFPLKGVDEGAIRVYATNNFDIYNRSASYKIKVNGVEQSQPLTISQDHVPVKFVLSANNITLKPDGGSSTLTVTANVDWVVDYDNSLSWLTVTRDGNNVTFTAPKSNDTGAHLTTTVYIRGVEPFENEAYAITVTQLSVLFFDDFSWIPCTQTPPVCWVTPDNNKRIDMWVGAFGEEVDSSILTSWTSVAGTHKPLAWSTYNYITLGASAYTGNICSPAIPSIQGSINAKVTWNMVGFCSKKNVRADCNEYYVALMGPGRITGATANNTSTAQVATGRFTIPYNTAGEGTDCDIYLTEMAEFSIGTDAYFTMDDQTGLEVWTHPDAEFSITVEGMTSETRVVFIGSEADKVTMLTGWNTALGQHTDSRKCLDNFRVEQD